MSTDRESADEPASSSSATALPVLGPRDWAVVARDYFASAPYNFAVLDGFLPDPLCRSWHRQLSASHGWSPDPWTDYLRHPRPDLPELPAVAQELAGHLPEILGSYRLVSHAALLYRSNEPGRVHADDAAVAVTIWLTGDEHNLDPERGGLLLFDVKRPAESLAHEPNLEGPAADYVAARTRGGRISVPYRCNRAVLFDARTFHQTDVLRFASSGPQSYRINLTLGFDDPALFERRCQLYRSLLSSSSPPRISTCRTDAAGVAVSSPHGGDNDHDRR